MMITVEVSASYPLGTNSIIAPLVYGEAPDFGIWHLRRFLTFAGSA